MKHILNILGFLTFVFVIQGCSSPIILEDYYTLYPPDEWCDDYYLMCKLSDGNDPLINDVDYIKWSKEMIVVRQKDSVWWVIKARGKSLKCCNQDELIGPLDEKEARKFLSEMSYPKGEMNLKDM